MILAPFALAILGLSILGLATLSLPRSIFATRRPLWRAFAATVGIAAVVISCGRDMTGPNDARGSIAQGVSFIAMFPVLANASSATSIVPFTKVRVLFRHSDGTVALDTVVTYGVTDADQMQMAFKLRLLFSAPSSGEQMTLSLAYASAAGDTVFRAGPVTVLVVPNRPGIVVPSPIPMVVHYSGAGANAASVRISPRVLSVAAGDLFTLTASAADASGATIPNTPIAWRSLDATAATFGSATSGAGTAKLFRGAVRIVAELLTGQADTATLTITPRLGAIVSVSGSGQSGPGGASLAQPVVVKVTATDGLALAGVPVTFGASAGGSVGTASVVTDASGLAQTTWQLATALGAQALTATVTGISTPVTFTATSTSGPAATLAIATGPVDGTAGAVLAPIVVSVLDANGNKAVYSGPVTMAFGVAPTGVTLLGTTTVNAVAGVATFSALRIRKAATGYTLVASGPSLVSVTTSAFTVNTAPAFSLALSSGDGQSAVASTLLASPIVALVSDSCGNPVSGFPLSFTVSTGGGSLAPATATTGADGTASSRWSLGPDVGMQVMAVKGTGLTPPSVGAVASASPVAQLQFVAQPTSVTAGVVMGSAVTVRAMNAAGATDVTFTGNVTLSFGNNPTGATLGGTLTVAAVSGVATFNTLRIRKTGTAFSLAANASGWAGATSSSFNVTAAPAVAVSASSGSGQTGPTSTALTSPLVALVSDSCGNGVSGASVTWATGSGSLSPTSGTTGAAGTTSTTWTLGATGGAVSATATVSALTPATFTATANAPVGAYSKTWNGSTSTDWSTAANWTPSGVPSASDSILIPNVPTQPLLSAAISVGKLTIATGATLDLNGFALNGSGAIVSQGLLTGATSGILGSAGVSFAGNFGITSIYLLAPASLTGATSFSGNLTETSGLLAVNGYTLTVAGNATMNLLMTNAADSVNVGGTFTVNTGNITPNLTAGTIVVGGDFIQMSMYQTFPARGTHKVVMKGSSVQHIKFYFSTNRFSHFNDLVIDNPAGVVADSVNYDNGGGYMFGGITEVARHLTILNGTLSGVSGSYLVLGGTLTDAAGGRLTIPKVYFDSSTTPVSSSTAVLTVANVYLDGLYFGASLGGKRASLGGNLTINGNLYIQNGDTLRLNGHALTVNGALSEPSGSYAALEMTNGADLLTVTGDMNLYGYPTAGTFSAGTIYAGGALNASLFQASGSHKLVMNGSGAFLLSIGSGDSTNVYKSRLNDLEIANTAPLTLSLTWSGLYVNGTFTKTTTAATTLKWSATAVEKLIVGAVNVTQPITFDRVQFWLVGGGAVTAFNNASFVNSWYYPAEDPAVGGTQQFHLVVNRGGAGNYTFNGLSFSNSTPQSPGPSPRSNPWAYVQVQGPAGLNVSLAGTTPSAAAAAGKFGAVIPSTLTWTP